ncbi:MAG: hypothetical protein ACT4PT_04560 [Methanobacteriota archaeon]
MQRQKAKRPEVFSENRLFSVLGRAAVDRRNLRSVAMALLLVAMMSTAAVSIAYNTQSTQTLSLLAPPIVWIAGPDSSGNDHVASWTLSSNATFFTITVKPVPEANVTWGNLTTLKNQGSTSKTVTVTGTSASSYVKILDWKIQFFEYSNDALIGTLDMKAGSPSVALGARTAGQQAYAKQWIKLDNGTGQGDLPSTVNVGLTIS